MKNEVMNKEHLQLHQPEKIIELKNVAVSYKERKSFFKSTEYKALKDISFDVYKGEVLGVIGRNGAGKSTLLRLLAGIIKPDNGKVIHHTRSVSLMALAAGFDPNLSGRQNAIISGMLMGYSKKYIYTQLEEIKTFSELQVFFEKPAKTYSSGMRARLAFSIAMYISPDVLLIDEVLGVGDVSFKNKANKTLQEKIYSDVTVVMVSHSESEVSKLSDRLVWIDGGKVRKEGIPSDIFPEYNLNVKFSTFGLKVDEYILHDDFIIHFDYIKIEGEKLNFNCVLIDKKSRSFDSIYSMTLGVSNHITGPTPSKIYEKDYPEYKLSGMSRYHGCISTCNPNKIVVQLEDKMVEVLNISFSEV
ncbi:ABC transporter ATP-binding protein [Vibrio sp. TRT 1302]|uniref:ABC transporter ATP-binding protein n=1 Tax=Vibrio sp. TRT 1302 TaxID=3418504 RepID=UPI003CED5956